MKNVPADLSSMRYKELLRVPVDYLAPRRYIIALDDVWDRNLWRDINVSLQDEGQRSRVDAPTALTVESSTEQKAAYEKWEHSNCISLIIMKGSITTFGPSKINYNMQKEKWKMRKENRKKFGKGNMQGNKSASVTKTDKASSFDTKGSSGPMCHFCKDKGVGVPLPHIEDNDAPEVVPNDAPPIMDPALIFTDEKPLRRVLYLEDVPVEKLSNKVGDLLNLSYLNLKGTKLKELPKSTGRLNNLQTLDIRDTKVDMAPDGIGKL
ncbi:hypothetical protein RJ639_044703 [Escallonia herrerae]|uniref:Uncharacterized protein n=1 Tax=Escallonia herrerae TaxID=1293975 RepID=A0AA89B1J6_9ASTE|nr:hypothetical protein RJ639_044703 [Escallonia herrerae]